VKAGTYRPAAWIAGGIVVLASVLYAWSHLDAATISPAVAVEQLREKLLGFGGWAALISGSLMMLQSVIPPLPSNVITITNGLLFGPLWGALLSWFSMLLGASACFFLSRRIGRPFASRIVGPSLHNAEGFFKRYGVHAVFIVRIVPFVPFDAVSYAAGVLGVPFPRFLLASGIGLIPSVLIYTFVGPVVLAHQSWLILVGLCVTITGGFLLLRWFHKNWPTVKNSGETIPRWKRVNRVFE
jgi:uncharacterized membrane protein YdjX (TVP38/TMEM64 family)